jgi:hypothetical protein
MHQNKKQVKREVKLLKMSTREHGSITKNMVLENKIMLDWENIMVTGKKERNMVKVS